ncbi:PRC-barrel domain-containing protein [Cryobacterium sp. MLB-32]|uniref:PRC-barrel domain-containing protein n=1 Tax=Cryobacterium sp. MLB-32 TaxID=1529318 RepID=UPI00068F4056|nr:PRC-barrel domain-containing protein [Cryobacterium sp. MLB-32]
MITVESLDDIVVNGGIVITRDGQRLGSVEQVFLSADSGDPAFVTVRTGLFGMQESFVPLFGATITASHITVAYDRGLIRQAPRIESDRGSITTDEESALYDHYGIVTVTDVGTLGTLEADAAAPELTAAHRPPPPPHDLTGHPGPPHPPHPPHLQKHSVEGHPHPPAAPPRPHEPPPAALPASEP